MVPATAEEVTDLLLRDYGKNNWDELEQKTGLERSTLFKRYRHIRANGKQICSTPCCKTECPIQLLLHTKQRILDMGECGLDKRHFMLALGIVWYAVRDSFMLTPKSKRARVIGDGNTPCRQARMYLAGDGPNILWELISDTSPAEFRDALVTSWSRIGDDEKRAAQCVRRLGRLHSD